MKYLASLFVFLVLISSNKYAGNSAIAFADEDLLKQTQTLVKNYNKGEKVTEIHKVEYFRMKGSLTTVIYYYSNLGYSNIIITRFEEEQKQTGALPGGKGYASKCMGSCNTEDCMVLPVIDEKGQLEYIECTCPGCKLYVSDIN